MEAMRIKRNWADEGQISMLLHELCDGIRSKNAQKVTSLYAAKNMMFTLAPPLRVKPGNSPGVKGIEEWFSSFSTPIAYDMTEIHIETSGDLAFSHSLNHISGQKIDGPNVDLWFRETFCFRRIGSEWKIAHQHQSVPFYMDGSDRAATDLRP